MISHFFFFLPYVRLVILQILYKYIFLVYWSTQRTVTRWHCLQNVDFDDDEDDLNMEEEECKSPNALLYYFYLPKSSKLIKKKKNPKDRGDAAWFGIHYLCGAPRFFFFFLMIDCYFQMRMPTSDAARNLNQRMLAVQSDNGRLRWIVVEVGQGLQWLCICVYKIVPLWLRSFL